MSSRSRESVGVASVIKDDKDRILAVSAEALFVQGVLMSSTVFSSLFSANGDEGSDAMIFSRPSRSDGYLRMRPDDVAEP